MPVWPKNPDGEFKAFVYEQFSRIGKTLSSPQRLIILNILCQGEHTVESLARHAGLTVANLSRHLQILKATNMVKMRRGGKYTYYSLSDEQTCTFFGLFKEFGARQLLEIQAAMEEISTTPSRVDLLGLEQLRSMVEDGEAIIIDVRPAEEYQKAHLPGAISMPLDQLEIGLQELPKDRHIVAYCRGKFCILADKAVEILRSHGFQAVRAGDGVVEWRDAGLPLE